MKHCHALSKLALAIVMVVVASTSSAEAIELTRRSFGGREYFCYEVQPKETIYGLCRELGITQEQLIAHNPTVADGLRAGTLLMLPAAQFPHLTAKAAVASPAVAFAAGPARPVKEHQVEKGETLYGISRRYGVDINELLALNPTLSAGLKHGVVIIVPDTAAARMAMARPTPRPQPAPATTPAPTLAQPEATVSATPAPLASPSTEANIAVILPFMLHQPTPEKSALLHTDFFKGFLLAADSLRTSKRHINIRAYDSAGSIDSVKAILAQPEMANADVIITPDDDAQVDAIAAFASHTGASVFNVFAVKNTSYINNANVMQATVSHSALYDRVVSEFLSRYPNQAVVFLSPTEGKADKKDFTSTLRKALASTGRKHRSIAYSGYLKDTDLAALDPTGSYVFVPESGVASEFSHIAGALKTYREERNDPNQVRLFGYPEWTTIRGQALETLHSLSATIYSRFFNDESAARTKEVSERFRMWYGSPMMAALPVQGLLGFDAGCFIINALNASEAPLTGSLINHDGVQSAFHFSPLSAGLGKINDTLYFVEFRPSGIIDKQQVKE